MSEVTVFGTDYRKERAIIIDSKLGDALLNVFIYSAELVDNELYKELLHPETGRPFKSAKEYFETKSISIRQAYRYAYIGREIKPHLHASNKTSSADLASIGVAKIEEMVRHASDEIPRLMAEGTITLGDEEYSVEDLKETSFKNLKEELKKISKKVEKNELLEEQNKTLTLEKTALEKELKEERNFNFRYRETSDSFDQIDEDLKAAASAWETVQVRLNRIESDEIDSALALRLKTLIESIQMGAERIPYKHEKMLMELMNEEL